MKEVLEPLDDVRIRRALEELEVLLEFASRETIRFCCISESTLIEVVEVAHDELFILRILAAIELAASYGIRTGFGQ